MVADQLAVPGRNVTDEAVLQAMRTVPREHFVPRENREAAYEDRPLPIGEGQTISQPFIVAKMTELLGLKPDHRVLEIGTGCGYQTAILAELAATVHTIEVVPELAGTAAERLRQLGYQNVTWCQGDGYAGWPEAAPFDAIIVTCAPEHVPNALAEQLAEGGRLVVPVGSEGGPQHLLCIHRLSGKLREETLFPVLFVPMTGRARESNSA